MLTKQIAKSLTFAVFVSSIAHGQTPAPTTPPPPPDYSSGVFNGKPVYIAQTHKVTLESNKQYITKTGIPSCKFEMGEDPKVIQHSAEALAGFIIKAAASGAGAPWLAMFAGPLVGAAGKAAQDVFEQSGGDLKKVIVKTGLGQEYAACATYVIVVPKGSKIVSINGFTDRTGFNDKKITKTSDGPTAKCVAKPPDGNLYTQDCTFAAWKYSESGPVVSAVLMNWSNEENVDGNLKVAFKDPPSAWAKKHPRKP